MNISINKKEQVLSVKKLIEEGRQGIRRDFTLFYGHRTSQNKITESCFSQWFMMNFEVEGKTYLCMEQYMMEQKALLFDDLEIANAIMESTRPNNMKSLGRKVKHFSASTWDEYKYSIVYKGNLNKFGQNKSLLEFMLSTGDSILVEASPVDRVWGIGMPKNNALAKVPEQWLGQNLLGFALTEVREHYKEVDNK